MGRKHRSDGEQTRKLHNSFEAEMAEVRNRAAGREQGVNETLIRDWRKKKAELE